MPFFVNMCLILRDICFAQHLYLLHYRTCFIIAWTDATCLNHVMNITVKEIAFVVYADCYKWCMSGNATKIDIVGCTEIAEAIGNESAIVHFNSTSYVGAMTIDNVGSMINAEMGKLT